MDPKYKQYPSIHAVYQTPGAAMFYKGVALLSNCRNEGWRWGVGHEIVTAGKKQRIKQRGGVGESY